jgi:hypothetical protein
MFPTICAGVCVRLERQELLEGAIPDSKIVVCRNGIDAPAQLSARDEFATSEWKFETGTVSRTSHYIL